MTGLFANLASNLASAGDENDRHSLEAAVNRYLDLQLDKAAQTSDWSRALSEYEPEPFRAFGREPGS